MVWVGPVTAVYLAALVVGALLPFAIIRPILVTPWLSLTDDKLVLLAAVAAWLLLGARAWPTPAEWRALAPSLTLLLVASLSALLAPDYAEDALKFIWRLAAGAFLFLVVLRLAADPRQRSGVVWAVLLGAGVSGLLGLAEALNLPGAAGLLSAFKVAPTRVGGELRVGATFQYATIAAMYFEMVAPLAIVVSASASRGWQRRLALGVAGLATLNVVLSLTRAGMLTLALVSGGLLAGAWFRADLRRLLLPSLSVLAMLLVGVAWLWLRNPVFDLRLATESDADWYAAAYALPASLELQPGQSARIGLDVTNTGLLTWSNQGPHPFALGYRWLTDDAGSVVDGASGEIALPGDVRPGQTLHLEAVLDVPDLPAGSYRLDWGMLQHDVLQFSERSSSNAQTRVRLLATGGSAQPAAPPATYPRDDGQAPWVVGRLELWRAALRLIQTRPLIGIGPDNFRHVYGAELGLETWDERVQANNLYLELLVDVGVLGLAAFLWLTLSPLLSAARSLRAPVGSGGYLVLGAALGVVAFLVHGALDAFLAFVPTAVLFWMLLGLIVGRLQNPQVSGRW